MSTVSTAPTVIDALLSTFNAGLTGVTAHEAWPGPADAAGEMVVLGEIAWDDYRIATIKAGRQQRQEDWSIGFEVFSMGGVGTTAANPKAERDRAFVTLAAMENVLANDPRDGLAGTVVQWVQIRPTEAGPRVFEKGWAYRIAGRVVVAARLT